MSWSLLRHTCLLALWVAFAQTAQGQLDRDWKIFVVPFSHVDVGYTASVETVIDQHSTYLDSVVAYVERYKSNPVDTRFRWSTEVSWQLENYLETRSPEQIEKLMSLIRQGYIDLNAMYLSVQTDLCGPEELARLLYYSDQIAKKYDYLPVGPAVTNDTPGFTWGLAQLLEKAELPYFSLAMNSALSDFYATTDIPNLFWWEAQSGHRTLVWRSIHNQWAYLEGAVWGVYGSYTTMESRITNVLNQLANDGYPYDFVLINAATGDNGAPNPNIVNNAQAWNDNHDGSTMRVATFSDFFRHVAIESGARDTIPVYSGDAPNWWSLWFASSASRGHLTSRKAQALLPAAETAASIASIVDPTFDYPEEALDRAYKDNLLYEDHNMGAGNNRPSDNEAFWTLKMGWVENALSTAQEVFASGIDHWAAQVETRSALQIAVFNVLPWTRSEVVRLPADHPLLDDVRAFELVDNSNGRFVPHQRLSTGEFAFRADSVPGLGYKTFRIAENTGPIQGPTPLTGSVLDNGLYRIEVGETGGAISVHDYALDREWAVGNEQLNQYRWNGSGVPVLALASSDSGEVLQRIVLQGEAPGSDSYQTEVVLPAGQKRIDFYDTWDKRPPTTQETVDFFFDFDAPGSKLQYEIPFGNVRLFDDELSGFNMKHYESQRWSTISDDNTTVVLSSSGPGLHAYPAGFTGRVRFLTSWDGAGSYRAGTGLLDAGFSITSHDGPADPAAATRAGYGFSVPLEPRILPRNQSGLLTPAAYSLVDVQGATLQLSTLKRWRYGNDLVARFYNPSPEPVDAYLFLPGTDTWVYEGNLLEQVLFTVKRGGSAGVHFGPHEVKTLLLSPQRVGASDSDELPSGSIAVDAPYPNPFANDVHISFVTASPSIVRVAVHDVLGRTVARISDEWTSAGRHETIWDGRTTTGGAAAAGVYVVSLESKTISGERRRVNTTVVKSR